MKRFVAVILMMLVSTSVLATGIPTIVGYQGRLTDTNGDPVADGNHTAVFSIYAGQTTTTPIWNSGSVTIETTDGLFTYVLGSNSPLPHDMATGSATPDLWLGITVDSSTAELYPRTRFTAVPYAFHAIRCDTATHAASVFPDAVGSTQVINGSIALEDLATDGVSDGQIIKFTGTAWTFAADDTGSGSATSYWTKTGDILATDDFWGLTRGNGQNALLGANAKTHVNLGAACTTGTSGVNDAYATVSGGVLNHTGNRATCGGGARNDAAGDYSSVSGGYENTVSSVYGTSAGGYGNTVGQYNEDTASAVLGGYENSALRKFSTVAGGYNNTADSAGSSVLGGINNTASGRYSVVGGGGSIVEEEANIASGRLSVVGGGWGNQATGFCSMVGGGGFSVAGAEYAIVAGGYLNRAESSWAYIGGGWDNRSLGIASTVGGGRECNAEGAYSTVAGGYYNTSAGSYSTIGGGHDNQTTAMASSVGGGMMNEASGIFSFIGGGRANASEGDTSVVCGGAENTAVGRFAFIGGGKRNYAAGKYSCILGNYADTITAAAEHSTAFGDRVYLNQSYRVAFFQGPIPGYVGINRDNHSGTTIDHPLHIGTNTGNGNGAHLTAGGTWTNGSSRTFKEDFESLDGAALMEKIEQLQSLRWRYKGTTEHHIGPMAEDFAAAFDVGTTRPDGTRENNYLAAADVAGVALVAVKELHRVQRDLIRKTERIEQLEKRLERLERLMLQMTEATDNGRQPNLQSLVAAP